MKLTSAQLDAVTAEGNLLVSAAAGAGKTAVLTERLCRRVAMGTPVERLLVLTFTRAAAGEMKERIALGLESMSLMESDPDKARRLYEEAQSVSRANISTIDAFCLSVVKRFGQVNGLPMKLRVADETELAALAQKARDTLLNDLARKESPELRALLEAFGSEDALWEGMMQLKAFLDARPDPEQWLRDSLKRSAGEEAADAFLEEALSFLKDRLAQAEGELQRERDALPPDMAGVISVLDGELTRYRGMRILKGYDAYRQGLADMEYATLRFPRDADPEVKRRVRSLRDAAKKCVRDQREALARSREEERRAFVESGALLDALGRVTMAYRETFAALKRERGAMDFSDAEHFALSLLEKEAVAAEYREKFDYIAVDEYQDTNRLGEAILSRVRREDNVFLVGDVKQSIYRFRQADPGLFMEKAREFQGGAGRTITLNQNFRSAGEVLDAVNEVFSSIMSTEAGELRYGKDEALRPGAGLPPGGAELNIISREYGEEEELEAAADAEVEARLAAVRIREWMERETYADPRDGKQRPLKYGDFAILLRGVKNADVYTRTLAKLGIPAYAQSSGGYFDAIEVAVALNALRIVDNPRQDIPLISVLMSGMGGFTASRLLELRLSRREGPFHEAFFASGEEDVRKFAEKLNGWREDARFLPVSRLIASIVDTTGFGEETACLPGGEGRLANLEALTQKARAFEASGGGGPGGFVKRMDAAKNNASVGAAQTVGADVVRVMSMHRSKGLEFPVVILAGLGTKFNMDELKKPLLIHPLEGMSLRRIDPQTGGRVTLCSRRVLGEKLRASRLAEEMRVLYVAMTRARHRLVMVGCAYKAEELMENAPARPLPRDVLGAANMLTWLTMGQRKERSVALYPREAFLGGFPQAGGGVPFPGSDPALLESIRDRFGWSYPFLGDGGLPAKTAVSRLAREESELLRFNSPAFAADERAAAASRGTAFHAALMRLPMTNLDGARAEAFLEELVEKGLLSPRQRELVDAEALSRFTLSPLFTRMTRSPRLERELPFALPVEAREVYQTESRDTVLLQGVLDACFMEGDAWVLLDYKTDYVPKDVFPREAAMKHETQLKLYAKALETLTGMPVKEKYVVLLSIGEAVAL